VLVRDPIVNAVLQDQPQDVSARTVRHRFLRATGLTQSHVLQMVRARRAEALLQSRFSILDTVEEAGYFDQPHLTRALKHWIGHTPAQIIRMSQPACQSVQDSVLELDYAVNVQAEIR
jgi:AraC-like DNA-binding protein